jgi:hypothetical protein
MILCAIVTPDRVYASSTTCRAVSRLTEDARKLPRQGYRLIYCAKAQK